MKSEKRQNGASVPEAGSWPNRKPLKVKKRKLIRKQSLPTPTGSSLLLRGDTSAWPTDRRLRWLKSTVAIAFILGFCFSWRLWISSRLFPLSPLSESLPAIPFPVDYVLFFSVLAILLPIAVISQPRRLMFCFLGLAVLLSLWDQTRWQPWFYQYLLMLAAIAIDSGKSSETKTGDAALNSCLLVIAATYSWSGVQKLNANFVKETWPDLAGSFLRFLPSALRNLPPGLILAIPILEIAIGLGLLTQRFRHAAVAFAVTTHVFVLLLLISGGENTVVWPWNVAMVLLVVVLFWGSRETSPQKIIAPRHWFHVLILLLVAALPALSFFDLWDSYLSSALYSGNTDQAVIYVSRAAIERMPTAIHPHIWTRREPFFVDINRWSYGDLNVPLYPEPRIYKNVAERICAYAGNSASDIRLRIKKKPNLLTGARQSEFYDCDHLE